MRSGLAVHNRTLTMWFPSTTFKTCFFSMAMSGPTPFQAFPVAVHTVPRHGSLYQSSMAILQISRPSMLRIWHDGEPPGRYHGGLPP